MNNRQSLDRIDGIAVIGMAGRFPGAHTIEEFWDNLSHGVESITHFTEQELLEAGVQREIVSDPRYVRAKGVLADIDLFDAAFFGYSPRDAKMMDPQHRLFLECAWESLEQAGYTRQDESARVGVYAGASLNTYVLATNLFTQISMAGDPVPTIVNNDKDFLATRVSYKLNLRGPGITVQTACSTSLVAIHLACQSLLSGECTMALAGGVSARVPHKEGYIYQGEGIVSPDGHCRAFDDNGRGTVVGEGVGVVVLKRVEDALADRDEILAVIRGSAINNDGSDKVGYTAPGMNGQIAVIEEALAIAGVAAETISYIEAHGTGTALGDPLEVAALTQAYRATTNARQFCALGSVKTNIGHLDAAAGVAGFIKAVLSLSREYIPPSLHFERPNSHINFTESPFYVNARLKAWPRVSEHPRRCGVSSFGIGGTNAHIILEEAPSVWPEEQDNASGASDNPPLYLFPLSARSPEALQHLAKLYTHWLEQQKSLSVYTICSAASLRREHHHYRQAFLGSTHDALIEQLQTFLQNPDQQPQVTTNYQKIVFVCPGQGSQWKGMAWRLLRDEPIFRAQMQRCAQVMEPYTSWSLFEQIEERADWQDIAIIQPTLFAIQVSLAALWRSWGIEPDAVIGHSMGEVAAACIAQILSLKDAARIICQRSQLLHRIHGQGSMMLVERTYEQASRLLDGFERQVSIAASNGPHATVLAGETKALEVLSERLQAQKIFWRWVKVDVASHSPQVDVLQEELLHTLQGLQPRLSQLPFYSTVVAHMVKGPELGAQYWVNNLRKPVLFAQTLQLMLDDDYTLFLELSPHPVLLTALQENIIEKQKNGLAFPSMRRETDERTVMLQTLAQLYKCNRDVDWAVLYPDGGSHVSLPTYPFQRQSYWISIPTYTLARRENSVESLSTFLAGRRLRSPLRQQIFEYHFTIQEQASLAVCRVHKTAMVPLTFYLEMVRVAAASLYTMDVFFLEQFTIHDPLFLPDNETCLVHLVLTPAEEVLSNGVVRAEIFHLVPESTSGDTDVWILHASGLIQLHPSLSDSPLALIEVQAACKQLVSPATIEQQLSSSGLHYLGNKSAIEQICIGTDLAFASIRSTTDIDISYSLSVELFVEIGAQVLYAASQKEVFVGTSLFSGDPFCVPSYLQILSWHEQRSPIAWCSALVLQNDDAALRGSLAFYAQDGRVVATIKDLHLARLSGNLFKQAQTQRFSDLLYELNWERKELHEARNSFESQKGTWIILADRQGAGESLARQLLTNGERSILVYQSETFVDEGMGIYRVNAASAEHLQRFCKRLEEDPKTRYRGLIHLWSIDSLPSGTTPAEVLAQAEMAGCHSILAFLHALLTSQLSEKPRLWLVTRGAQPVQPMAETTSLSTLTQAMIWGLGQSLAIEHPTMWGGLIDLDPSLSLNASVAALFAEMQETRSEDQIALRLGQRYVARLVKSEAQLQQTNAWRADGIYLITGGLGYLGLLIANSLVRQGAKHIWLVSRTGVGETQEKQLSLRALKESGALLRIIQADISDTEQIEQLDKHIRATSLPLIGIIHAAGVATPQELKHLSWESFQSTLRPKTLGAWLLHELAQRYKVETFLLFSTVVSVWGSRGLAHHAAANRFLDALAHFRRSQGLPALAINWGPWAGGSHGSPEAQIRLEQIGIDALEPAPGLGLLDLLSGIDKAQIVVAQMNWYIFKPAYEAQTQRRLLEYMHIDEQTHQAVRQSDTPKLVQRLRQAQVNEQRTILLTCVRSEIATVLGIEQPQSINGQRPLRELGLESLMSIELRNRLQNQLGEVTALPSTIVFEYPTVNALVEYLLQEVSVWNPSKDAQSEYLHNTREEPGENEQKSEAENDFETTLLEELKQAGY